MVGGLSKLWTSQVTVSHSSGSKSQPACVAAIAIGAQQDEEVMSMKEAQIVKSAETNSWTSILSRALGMRLFEQRR